jgi:hypothetical protein
MLLILRSWIRTETSSRTRSIVLGSVTKEGDRSIPEQRVHGPNASLHPLRPRERCPLQRTHAKRPEGGRRNGRDEPTRNSERVTLEVLIAREESKRYRLRCSLLSRSAISSAPHLVMAR